MRHYALLLISVIVLAASCVKDRTQADVTPIGPINTAGDSLMYYWNFNNDDSSNHHPDFAIGTGAFFTYNAAYIDYTAGSTIGRPDSVTEAGDCLRVRNPSTSLIFNMPTTGYKSVVLQFAEQRSNSGPSQNSVYYTTDGLNYVSTALGSNNTYTVDTLFGGHSFDFSSDAAVNNNANFAVKIVFNNNNTGTSGNDRIDNVSLVGIKQ